MFMRFFVGFAICFGTMFGVMPGNSGGVRADMFLLKNGGRIRGKLVNESSRFRKEYVIRTASGAVVTLDKSQIKKRLRERPELAAYEKIAPSYADTVEGQRKLAEWCHNNKLRSLELMHQQRIVELDPNDTKAHRVLGHVKLNNQWMTKEEKREKQGHVQHNGDAVTKQDLKLRIERERKNNAELKWFAEIKMWRSWAKRGGEKLISAKENFEAIDDPNAVRALIKFYDSEKNRTAKLWYIDALGRIGTGPALGELMQYSLDEDDEELRVACFENLEGRKNPSIVSNYAKALKSSKSTNPQINRAAVALRYVGSKSAVRPLIDALVTEHKFKIGRSKPGQISSSFNRNGGGGLGGSGLGVGGSRPKIVRRTFENQEVLATLVELTNVNFSFDRKAWLSWYASQQKPQELNGRRN